MDKKGGLLGGVVSEVMNVHSQKLYMVSTAPEIGQDYWSTSVIPINQRKVLFGLFKFNSPDFYHQLVSFIRNSKADAYAVHAEVRHIVTSISEAQWFDSFPSPKPPDGYSEGARRKLKDMLGHDPI